MRNPDQLRFLTDFISPLHLPCSCPVLFPHTGSTMLENFRLRVFREVARQHNFRRAAEVLFISQPAVTQQIKALEQELGHKLLDRSGGTVRLTAAGETLLRFANESELLLTQAAEALSALDGEVRGTLRLAASTTIAQYLLPHLLASFGRQNPGVALELESANTVGVVARVAEGSVALGLIEGPAHRADLLMEPWINDELVLVVPRGHAWAGRIIGLTSLREVPLLLREHGSGTRAVLEAALRDAGLPLDLLRVSMLLGSTEALLACVEAGLGVGFASRFALRRQTRLGTLAVVRVRGLRVRRTLHVIRQRGPQTAGVAESFADFLRDYARRRSAKRASLPDSVPPGR